MILKEILPEYYSYRAKQTFSAPYGLDDPAHSWRGADDWHAYPLKDFVYSFNSWAFRGKDYAQYKGKPVNICLGDSFTLNVGGPIEHSWPSQLSENFDIPTLNFGIDGAGNDMIKLLYAYLIDYFDVQATFVMYSFFHRRYDNSSKSLVYTGCLDDRENFSYFENNKLTNVYYTFLPHWCWSSSEEDYISSNYKSHLFPHNTHNLNFLNNNRSLFISAEKYNNFKGQDWPTYKEFINNSMLEDWAYREIFVTQFNNLFHCVNRDGFHLDYAGNKMVCNYFLSQANRTPGD